MIKPIMTEEAARVLIEDWFYRVYSYKRTKTLEEMIEKAIEDWISGLDANISVAFCCHLTRDEEGIISIHPDDGT